MSNTLSVVSEQWSRRGPDERFLDLPSMQQQFARQRAISRATVVAPSQLTVLPDQDGGLAVAGPAGQPYAPSNWAFGQLASLAEAPAGYLRTLPAATAAQCLNHGLQAVRQRDVGLLLQKGSQPRGGTGVATHGMLRAATGPRYGRIWNADVVSQIINLFGDGVSGNFRVPGEFGVQVPVTQQNTTLYASDHDLFIFLADEQHRIEIPNRRDGKPGSLARGFVISNSEVGGGVLMLMSMLFDYACMNRMLWGVEDVQEIRIKHTSGAPERYLEEVAPAIKAYTVSSSKSITQAIESTRKAKLADDEAVDSFLRPRFSKNITQQIKAVHLLEEGRPVSSLWDVSTGLTAYARTIDHQDARTILERQAGAILKLAA